MAAQQQCPNCLKADSVREKEQKMKDMQAHLEKLRRDAAECAIIRDLATDPKKRELFTKLADHLSVLAEEVERAIAKDR
jgi:hypothetical protein